MKTIIDDTVDVLSALRITESDGVTSGIEAIGDSLNNFRGSVSESIKVLKNGVDISSIGQAATAVVDRAFQEAYASLTATRKVKIKTLMGAAGGAFSQSPTDIIDNLAKSLNEFIGDFIVKAGDTLINDPAMKEAVQSLEEVQAIAQVVRDFLGIYDSVVSLGNKLEPAYPYIEIIVSAASIWWTGGASAAAFSSQAAQAAMQELKKLIPLILYPLKESILDMEIEVPYLLLGGLERLQTIESQQNWEQIVNNLEKQLTVDYDYYTQVTGDLKWAKNWEGATSLLENNILYPYIRQYVNEIPTGNALLYRQENGIDYWEEIESFAEDGADIPRILRFNDNEIISISKELLEAQDTTSSYYLDRQMHKLVLEQFKLDGAVLDIENKTYDERKTRTNPEGDRKAFKEINDRITLLHGVLEALTGECRANITEEIPVIDFYRKKQTGLDVVYSSEDFITIKKITDKSPLNTEAPTAKYLLDSDNKYFINFALSEYEAKAHFYNSLGRIPSVPSIQVDYASDEDNYILKASGLLNGLFTSPDTIVNQEVTSWKWDEGTPEGYNSYQELALTYGSEIPRGVRYNPAHLIGGASYGSRHIIGAPLYYEGVYGGLAEYYYHSILDAVNDQLIAGRQIEYSDWKSLGGALEEVSSIIDKSSLETVLDKETYKNWFLGKKKSRTVSKDNYISKGYYGYKLDYLIQNEDNLNLDFWKKISNNTLTLNINENPEAIAVTSKHVTRVSRRGFLSWLFTTKSIFVETEWLTHPTRVFKATLKSGDDVYHNPFIEKIECIMPQEVIRKKGYHNSIEYTLGDYNEKQARLLIPGDDYKLPNKMYLFSTSDLGFVKATVSGTKEPKSLCTFYNNDKMLIMEVNSIDYIQSPKEVDNFTVTYENVTITYNKAFEDSQPNPMPAPQLEVVGNSCYVYTLRPLKIDFEGDDYLEESLDLYPIKYPKDFFEISSEGVVKNFENTVASLENMKIAVGLPELNGVDDLYKNYKQEGSTYDVHSTNFGVMDFIAGKEDNSYLNLKPAIKQIIKNIPVITTDPLEALEGDDTYEVKDITLGDLHRLMNPLINASSYFEELSIIYKDLNLEKFIARIKSNNFYFVCNNLKDIFENYDDSSVNLLEMCKQLDVLLGDVNNPWIKIGDEIDDDVSERTLDELVDWIRTMLEGRGGVPVKYLNFEDELKGDPSSLYYQRYLFLNNRLHWNTGHLAQASQRLSNWKQATQATSGGYNKLEAYSEYMNVEDIVQVETLEYFSPKYDQDNNLLSAGGFYNKAVIDNVASKIDNKCALMCIECPVASTCPFFDHAENIKQYIPEEDSYEIWLKDNKLDLLVFEIDENTGKEYLDLIDENGNSFDVEAYKNRQKTYTEIVKDASKDYPLDYVRNSIGNQVENYNPSVESLGWLQGGRYGTLKQKPTGISYFYDAIFVRDEYSSFEYSPSEQYYPVKVDHRNSLRDWDNFSTYKGKVRIQIPNTLTLFKNSSEEDELYIVSDDTTDSSGRYINPVIYVGQLKNIRFAFDLREDESEDGVTSSVSSEINPGDVAQQHVNTINWLSKEYDQWWMSKIEKKSTTGGSEGTITVEGRKRTTDIVDPLVTSAPNTSDVLLGKPFVNTYVNFLRKMRIDLACFRWIKGDDHTQEEIEKKKQTLALMKTNVRLVLIKR